MNSKDDFSSLKIAALIVAGGNGVRMGHAIPKQYINIQGKPVLNHTLDVFRKIDIIDTHLCVINPDHEAFFQQAVEGIDPLHKVYGGATRQESVYQGLIALKDLKPDIVLIHDAARPCITHDDIHNLINNLSNHRAATLALPVTESIQRNGEVVDRENLWILQTPQAFYYNDILDAHETCTGLYTDDTALYKDWSGEPVHYVPCGRHNIKITTQSDLIMAGKFISEKDIMETITGLGFDVHAFDTHPSDSIRLCGIDIPYNKSLKGHSDADVVLHAITDALYGALGIGDIGSHFPPSNNDFRDMDSHIFLSHALQCLAEHGGLLRHLDITIMCEEPKIGPFREKMVKHLCDYMGLSANHVSVKATTTEKLGFTGRGEGIACQALVTVKVPYDD